MKSKYGLWREIFSAERHYFSRIDIEVDIETVLGACELHRLNRNYDKLSFSCSATEKIAVLVLFRCSSSLHMSHLSFG